MKQSDADKGVRKKKKKNPKKNQYGKTFINTR